MSDIQVGNKVRSYDFPGNDDCYVEGVVTAIDYIPDAPRDCLRYHIRVDREVRDGKELYPHDIRHYVYPPVNGTPTWLGTVTNGVKRLGELTKFGFDNLVEQELAKVYHFLMANRIPGSSKYVDWAYRVANQYGEMFAQTYEQDVLTGLYNRKET